MVEVDAVMGDAVDAEVDKARTIMSRQIQQRMICVAISAPMSSTMAKSLHQI
jgi:hypothetical protein